MRYELPALTGMTVSYELIDFPFVASELAPPLAWPGPVQDAETIARWLDSTIPARLPVAVTLLATLGAPQVDRRAPRQGLLELGGWLQRWFPLVAAPFVQRSYPREPDWQPNWLRINSDDRLGSVDAERIPQSPHGQVGSAVLHSLIVDLMAVVIAAAFEDRMPPTWQVVDGPRGPALALRRSRPVFLPLSHVRELLLQSVGPTRGERSRALRRRQSRFLADCFDQARTGTAPIPVEREFGESRIRYLSRFTLRIPPRSADPAPQIVLESVRALREVGFYESWKRSDDALAVAVQRAWALAAGRRLPSDQGRLWTCLILTDPERTWFEDVDVQLRGIADQLYGHTLFALERVGGRGFGGFADPEENWRSAADAVELTVRWRRRWRHIRMPKTADGVLHPALLQAVNALITGDSARFWFLDLGATTGCVVRLNPRERECVSALTGCDLTADPPGWWQQAASTGLGSLPANRSDPLLLGEPLGDTVAVASEASHDVLPDELMAVSVSDMEIDGRIVFSVFVSAAEFIRGGAAEAALQARITDALAASAGVTSVTREDREIWHVSGSPTELALQNAAERAVESVVSEFPSVMRHGHP